MQRTGSLQSARWCFLLRQRKHKPWKRLKKAARAAWAAGEALSEDRRSEGWRGGAGRAGETGKEPGIRPCLAVTTCQSWGWEGVETLTDGWEGSTAMDWRRGRTTDCWSPWRAGWGAPWTTEHGTDRLRPRRERSSWADRAGDQGEASPDPLGRAGVLTSESAAPVAELSGAMLGDHEAW
jgi:hypothetical protein